MAKVDTYCCDECSALKKEVNHWWDIDISVHADGEPYLMLRQHSNVVDAPTKNFCCIEHAQKAIARWMCEVAVPAATADGICTRADGRQHD